MLLYLSQCGHVSSIFMVHSCGLGALEVRRMYFKAEQAHLLTLIAEGGSHALTRLLRTSLLVSHSINPPVTIQSTRVIAAATIGMTLHKLRGDGIPDQAGAGAKETHASCTVLKR